MDDLIEFSNKVFKTLASNAQKLIFDKSNARELTLISLYGTAFELFASIVILSREGHFVGVPILLRGLADAAVDVMNLVGDSAYHRDLILTYVNKKIIRYQYAFNNQHSDLALAYGNEEFLRAELRILKNRKEQLKKQGGASDRDPRTRYSKAGMSDFHGIVYSELSASVHHDLEALAVKHLKADAIDGFNVEFFSDIDIDKKRFYIDLSVALMLQSTKSVYGYFDVDIETIRQLESEFDCMREL